METDERGLLQKLVTASLLKDEEALCTSTVPGSGIPWAYSSLHWFCTRATLLAVLERLTLTMMVLEKTLQRDRKTFAVTST